MYELICEDMGRTVDNTRSIIEEAKKGKLSDALRLYYSAKNGYDEFEKRRKQLGELIESMSRGLIPDMMAEEGVRTVTLEDLGYRFTVAQRVNCSMTDKEAGVDWLKENGHGSIVIETVNASTLSAFAKSYVEDTGRDLPGNMFKLSTLTYTSMTKS